MVDPKVYKTDYESVFTSFFSTLSAKEGDGAESQAVIDEREKYQKINLLRDHANTASTRNKLWEDF